MLTTLPQTATNGETQNYNCPAVHRQISRGRQTFHHNAKRHRRRKFMLASNASLAWLLTRKLRMILYCQWKPQPNSNSNSNTFSKVNGIADKPTDRFKQICRYSAPTAVIDRCYRPVYPSLRMLTCYKQRYTMFNRLYWKPLGHLYNFWQVVSDSVSCSHGYWSWCEGHSGVGRTWQWCSHQ